MRQGVSEEVVKPMAGMKLTSQIVVGQGRLTWPKHPENDVCVHFDRKGKIE